MRLVQIEYGKTATIEEKSIRFYEKIAMATKESIENIDEMYCGDIEICGNHYLIDVYHDTTKKNDLKLGYTYVYLTRFLSHKLSHVERLTNKEVGMFVFKR